MIFELFEAETVTEIAALIQKCMKERELVVANLSHSIIQSPCGRPEKISVLVHFMPIPGLSLARAIADECAESIVVQKDKPKTIDGNKNTCVDCVKSGTEKCPFAPTNQDRAICDDFEEYPFN